MKKLYSFSVLLICFISLVNAQVIETANVTTPGTLSNW